MLKLSDISISRGGRVLLEKVNFEVPLGCVKVLRGPNGAGKTSLLRTIAGLNTPVNGQVTIHAENVMYQGHENALKGQMTLAENLEFWAKVHGSKTSAKYALSIFGLEEFANRPAHFLSAGQKRRASLARLILSQGKGAVWLLDEPTVSLDKGSVKLFSQAVTDHIADGGCALIATHISMEIKEKIIDISRFQPQTHTQTSSDEAFL